ncbi:porin [Nocardia panacis]|uniref:Porin n=1 Tax=Nocardia panacis TaxID=2340916 RepID=A0A3A4JYL1_9NOCA|nr:MspA family porin [Nocardia panacis]RJO76395.1 porin [Nocardia panacis]
MINRKHVVRIAGCAAAVSAALGLLSIGAANADTFVPLPGGELTKTLSDGTVITVRLTDESANISPSMGATPVHRNAWVSGTASVQVSDNSSAPSVLLFPGYTVACQVNIAGGGVNGGVGGTVDYSDGQNVKPNVSANTGGNLSLGPGQATSFWVLDVEKADDYGREAHRHRNKIDGHSGSVTWADETIGLSGCGGYAQARAFISVELETDSVVTWTTLWGQPFSLG